MSDSSASSSNDGRISSGGITGKSVFFTFIGSATWLYFWVRKEWTWKKLVKKRSLNNTEYVLDFRSLFFSGRNEFRLLCILQN